MTENLGPFLQRQRKLDLVDGLGGRVLRTTLSSCRGRLPLSSLWGSWFGRVFPRKEVEVLPPSIVERDSSMLSRSSQVGEMRFCSRRKAALGEVRLFLLYAERRERDRAAHSCGKGKGKNWLFFFDEPRKRVHLSLELAEKGDFLSTRGRGGGPVIPLPHSGERASPGGKKKAASRAPKNPMIRGGFSALVRLALPSFYRKREGCPPFCFLYYPSEKVFRSFLFSRRGRKTAGGQRGKALLFLPREKGPSCHSVGSTRGGQRSRYRSLERGGELTRTRRDELRLSIGREIARGPSRKKALSPNFSSVEKKPLDFGSPEK